MLKWPCENNLGLKRWGVTFMFFWKPSSVLACGRHSVVVEAIVSSHISVVLVDNIFKR